MTEDLGTVSLPEPYAFPIGAGVRAGQYQGEVIEQRGPYSVIIREASGRQLLSTTTDMVLDTSAVPSRSSELEPPADLFSSSD